MKHFENVDHQQRVLKEKIISERIDQLYNITKESTSDVIKYLFNVNAGGCIALLAYLGSVKPDHIGAQVLAGLFCFAAGLVLVGVNKVITFQKFERLFFGYKEVVNQYYGGKIGWGTLIERDEKLSSVGLIPYIVGYLSFSFFLLGFAFCSYSFYFR